jgi:hypothetical protein
MNVNLRDRLRSSGHEPDDPAPAVKQRDRSRTVAALLVLLGLGLIATAWLPWFVSRVDGATRDINGMVRGSGNSWLFHVPIGWLLVAGGLAVIVTGLTILRPGRLRWQLPPIVAAGVGALGAAVILAERSHVHQNVRADLERALNTFVTAHPDQLERVQQTLASGRLRLDDGTGLWIAFVLALATMVTGVWLARRPQPVRRTLP